MNTRNTRKLFGGFIFVAASVFALGAQNTRPNVILILADDLGYGDIGPFGQKKIATPHLDRLAREGTVFTDVYAGAPVCAPSRCVLMTGLHTGHARVRGNAGRSMRDPLALALQPGDSSLGRVFKQAHYATGAVGKWGLGNVGAEASGLPTRHGFDMFFGFLNQAHAHNSYPSHVWSNEEKVSLPNEVPDEGPFGTGVSSNQAVYAQDLFIERALGFIREKKDEPFFLYFAPTLPHANNESQPLGLEIPSLGDYAARDWPESAKRFAAIVTRLDNDVGKILELLRELKLEEDTLVIFTSDNGPHREGGHDPEFFDSNGPLRGIKRDLYEGGIRVPMLVRWPGFTRAEHRDSTPWYFADFFATLAEVVGVDVPPSDGVSVLPLWQGKVQPALAERPMYWEFYEGGFKQAARLGMWKAVKVRLGASVELYDLSSDLREEHDVALQRPDKVRELEEFFGKAHSDNPAWPIRPVRHN